MTDSALPARLAALVEKWREIAQAGRRYQIGDAQWLAALSAGVYATCADQLAALLVGVEPPAKKKK